MTADGAVRPNILLVTADEMPGFIIDPSTKAQMPTVDYLGRLGARYRRAYSECPVCIPARRSLMTGTSPRAHGDRNFQPQMPMPAFSTLAETLGENGYQCYAVGKLHVYPQRDRIGFDDVILNEEGRSVLGATDDYEADLAEAGFPGRQFTHGMSNNDYQTRPWHLPDDLHPSAWSATQMSRMIRRRDPTRPGFWYLSFQAPHPPLVPPRDYMAMYEDADVDEPARGSWVEEDTPFVLRSNRQQWPIEDPHAIALARRAFYALCTHIDHQLRVVLGTLREEGILDQTLIVFTSDHGDMLGNHGLWAKRLFYEASAQIPMVVVPPVGEQRLPVGTVSDRLVGLADVMPTILDLVGVPIPERVDGRSLLAEPRADLYGEFGSDDFATRMITDGRHKLIYYPVGNVTQLFDLAEDPDECTNLATSQAHAQPLARLTQRLIENLDDGDQTWVRDGHLVGLPDRVDLPPVDRGLHGVRGVHWPPPPLDTDPSRVVGAPGG